MKYSAVFLLLLYLILSACSRQATPEKIITVTIEPQKFFADRLVDSVFEVEVMVPAGVSPETYDPTPVQMTKLAKSMAYFKVGNLGFEEAWMDKIASNNPGLRIFDTGEDISFIIMDDHDCDHDESEEEHFHRHVGIDPHTWTSPKQALIIVDNMYKALIELDPENEPRFTSNFRKLHREIIQTDSIITGLLAKAPHKSFIIYHPALSYFAEDYKLQQYSIEIEGKTPAPSQLKKLIDTARKEQVKVIFIQEEFDKKNAEIIAKETGCKTVVINPLSYDWDKEMIRIAQVLANE
jgi:ABC-type metal ion transport system, periplasmic component/surface adhesin